MATALGPPTERNQDATVYVGNLDPQSDEELVWEMFREAGPVVSVYVPKDRVTDEHQVRLAFSVLTEGRTRDADVVCVERAFVSIISFSLDVSSYAARPQAETDFVAGKFDWGGLGVPRDLGICALSTLPCTWRSRSRLPTVQALRDFFGIQRTLKSRLRQDPSLTVESLVVKLLKSVCRNSNFSTDTLPENWDAGLDAS